MNITELIQPDRVLGGLRVGNKAQLLHEIARRAAAHIDVSEQQILDALNAREQLGSTGVGEGVAVPHARIEHLSRFLGLFARLDRPIDFAAIDGQPVDLVFLLLSPLGSSSDHLAALACVSRRLRNRGVATRLRATSEPAQLYELLVGAGTEK
jgi:PTS system nitrogen regulatory IIA component